MMSVLSALSPADNDTGAGTVCRARTRRRAVTKRKPVGRRVTQQRPIITAQSSSSANDDEDDYSANELSSGSSSEAEYRRRTKWLTKRMAAQAVRCVIVFVNVYMVRIVRLSCLKFKNLN